MEIAKDRNLTRIVDVLLAANRINKRGKTINANDGYIMQAVTNSTADASAWSYWYLCDEIDLA